MKLKVGIDIIEIDRFKFFLEDEERLKKHFTTNEILYFNKFSEKLSHISGCFCAKEAFAKALKVGFGKQLSPIDIEVLHDKNGAVYINSTLPKIKNLLNGQKVEINISHSKTASTAICLIF